MPWRELKDDVEVVTTETSFDDDVAAFEIQSPSPAPPQKTIDSRAASALALLVALAAFLVCQGVGQLFELHVPALEYTAFGELVGYESLEAFAADYSALQAGEVRLAADATHVFFCAMFLALAVYVAALVGYVVHTARHVGHERSAHGGRRRRGAKADARPQRLRELRRHLAHYQHLVGRHGLYYWPALVGKECVQLGLQLLRLAYYGGLDVLSGSAVLAVQPGALTLLAVFIAADLVCKPPLVTSTRVELHTVAASLVDLASDGLFASFQIVAFGSGSGALGALASLRLPSSGLMLLAAWLPFATLATKLALLAQSVVLGKYDLSRSRSRPGSVWKPDDELVPRGARKAAFVGLPVLAGAALVAGVASFLARAADTCAREVPLWDTCFFKVHPLFEDPPCNCRVWQHSAATAATTASVAEVRAALQAFSMLEHVDVRQVDFGGPPPAELSQTPFLRSLRFEGLGLEELPDSLGADCPLLESLSVSLNNLTALPSSLHECPLVTLYAGFNDIAELPARADEWTLMEVFTVDFNELSEFPPAVRAWRGTVREVSLLGNDALGPALPAWVPELKRLESLNLAAAGLAALPDGLSALRELHTLDLAANNISALPDDFADLPAGVELELGQNPVCDNGWISDVASEEVVELLISTGACLCSPMCLSEFLGNAVCESMCDNAACGFDGGECDPSSGNGTWTCETEGCLLIYQWILTSDADGDGYVSTTELGYAGEYLEFDLQDSVSLAWATYGLDLAVCTTCDF